MSFVVYRGDYEPRPYPENPNYRVWSDGRIESRCRKGRPRKGQTGPNLGEWHPVRPRRDREGKQNVSMGGRTVRVHVAVARTFLAPPPFEGAHVLRYDGNKDNNHLHNLRWGTHRSNTQDGRRKQPTRGDARRERCPRIAIPESVRADILADRKAGLTIRELAEKHRVSQARVCEIVPRTVPFRPRRKQKIVA